MLHLKNSYRILWIMKGVLSNQTTAALFLFLFYFSHGISAQTPIRFGPASAAEIDNAFTALEADFNNLKAHRTYIVAKGIKNLELIQQYELWIKKYPDNVNIPLLLATVFHRATMPQPKDFLLQVATANPKNAEAWIMLSADASLRGQVDLSRNYLEKAIAADTANVGYAYTYLMTYGDSDPGIFQKKVFEFSKRFPDAEFAALAIFKLAEKTASQQDKIHYYSELQRLYNPEKFRWSAAGMKKLADIYLQTNPEKALNLINEMVELGDNDWKIRKRAAELYKAALQWEQDLKSDVALATISQIQLPATNDIEDFIALKKAGLQEKVYGVNVAFDSLAVKFAKLPTDALYSGMVMYGKKLGKDQKQIDRDIEKIRYSTAVQASPFELGLYTSNQKLSLNDLKGKVTLLTFWFPACGPCKEEFPHFQNVIDSYKSDSVAYLGVNVLPSQDDYVLPFIENNKFSFIPLRGTTKFAQEKYNVTGQPENFIIDKDGKIVFTDFRIDLDNRRTLQLMISSLLDKESSQQ